jgi:ammonium transporter, Amt family
MPRKVRISHLSHPRLPFLRSTLLQKPHIQTKVSHLLVKYWMNVDDALDIFAEHGVAGMLGLMANALFGADYIVGLDGVTTGAVNPTTGTGIGGWAIGNYRQFYIQLAYVVACTTYAFVMSAILAYAINLVPGLHLRASEDAELLGMDDDQLGEFAYDYVEVRRDYLAWTPAQAQPTDSNPEQTIEMKDRHGIPGHSDMFSGKANGDAAKEGHTGNEHTGVGGDRHGMAFEAMQREKRELHHAYEGHHHDE